MRFLLFFWIFLSGLGFSYTLTSAKNYLVYYGKWDESAIEKALSFELIILHPGINNKNITPSLIHRLKSGKDKQLGTEDDCLIIAYISIGEDQTVHRGPRVLTNKTKGPVSKHNNDTLIFSNNGFNNYYLDSISVKKTSLNKSIWGKNGLPETEKGEDKLPDENGKWGSFFVNVGSPLWHSQIKTQSDFLLNKIGCDGLFLDTVDTASPWGNYKWLEEPMLNLITQIREWHPDTTIIMNRGLFLFDHYSKQLTHTLDGVMFESYISEWDWHRKVGTMHRYFTNNKQIANTHLKRANTKGLRILFLNYLSTNQPSIDLYIYSLWKNTHQLTPLHYLTSPDLHTINTPFELPQYKKQHPLQVSVKTKKGNIRLKIKSQESLRFSQVIPFISYTNKASSNSPPFIRPLIDKEQLILPTLPNGDYLFHLTLISTKNKSVHSTDLPISIKDNQQLQAIHPQVKIYDQELVLFWDKTKNVSHYEVRWGKKKDTLNIKNIVNRPQFIASNLNNFTTYFFQVSAIGKDSKKGLPSNIIAATPTDCTPPPKPYLIKAPVIGNQVRVVWNQIITTDIAGYHIYLDPISLSQGYPLKIPSNTHMWWITVPHPGTYNLRLSAYDFHNNESKLTPPKTIIFNN
jgi:endo-alpha-1,4-polygalactosaminidase (GH114 family)